ncbi:MAG: hypothetical protein EBU90_11475 [Proteobacteria bacterium]|nr:hypothetical protein [Pseudomonadota bacterium]NBP14599.1 hypothetical protein [bacterium]
MNEIQAALVALLPSKKKQTPSGWTSFNAPCCQNRGERRDQRQRGGILINPAGGFQYHCFNCNFKAGWTPGHLLTANTKNMFRWLGLNETDLGKLTLYALKIKDDQPVQKTQQTFDLVEKDLPKMCLPLATWANEKLDQEQEKDLLEIFKYLVNRGMNIDWYPWHWSPSPGYKDRIILPFYHNGKIVGYTGRKITEGKPKYLTDAQPGYVFNIDRQTQDKKFVIICEGQFDAIAIDGCAIMHNEPNSVQVQRIKSLDKEVIVVPDRDRAGATMLKAAIENDWSVSMPPWESDIKDVADAVQRYGRLYTLTSILYYKETNKLKIEISKNKLKNAQT